MLNPRILLTLASKKMLYKIHVKQAILFLLPSSGVAKDGNTRGEIYGVTLHNV